MIKKEREQNKIVIYTAIFGGKDDLIEPEFISDNCDFVCFTDGNFKSDIWQIRKVKPIFDDPVRNAKIYKILPHKYLPEYKYSIWADGNMVARGNVNELVEKYLPKANLAIFDHTQLRKRFKKLFWIKDKKQCYDCIYREAEHLLQLEKEGNYKDNADLIKKQIAKYRREGYPENNGLIVGMVIARRHNESDVIKSMEDWWQEIRQYSRRDQLSFNYIAWKNNLNFTYIKGDSRRNKYFLHTRHKIRTNPK